SRSVSTRAVTPAPTPETTTLVRPAQREQVGAAIPAKFHARARRDAAAFYLTQLAKGVLAGELAIAVGDQQIQLATSEFVILKIKANQTQRANQLNVKARRPTPP